MIFSAWKHRLKHTVTTWTTTCFDGLDQTCQTQTHVRARKMTFKAKKKLLAGRILEMVSTFSCSEVRFKQFID